MCVTASACFYARVAKIAARTESCLCLLLGKVAGDDTELGEVIGLNFGRSSPSLPKALGCALEVRRAFYSHLTVVGIISIGARNELLRSVVADCARLLSLSKPLLGVEYSLESPVEIRVLDEDSPVTLCAGPVDSLSLQALLGDNKPFAAVGPLLSETTREQVRRVLDGTVVEDVRQR
ncbi:hypothetical protein GMRT_12549 [Giardia muris]|uniref:Uncharacterized protein n=1 Tax=Giardia muris TaxID=5742 RepID=A0A4Z1T5L0_GIAMU|nr:hypothetical protein GMRT_12549 [Giardia muris]|eukprot:TNJ28417.1 hypothetical protein GMRT_12549 [Giardia muris]